MASVRKHRRKRRSTPGSAPGQLNIDPQANPSKLHAIRYSASGLDESDVHAGQPPAGQTIWVNVDGLRNGDLLSDIAKTFGLHPLAMEDVVNPHQRPKAETYDDHIFVVLRMPHDDDQGFYTEQVGLFLGRNSVITFQEQQHGDVFDQVRARLRNPQSQLRSRGPDYLAYALIDAVTDAYFPVLESLGDRLEALADEVVECVNRDQIGEIQAIKHTLLNIRTAIWPLRDLLSSLLRDDGPLISERTRVYLRDCQDHTFQLIDMIETFRDIASGLVDIHLSSQSNSMNEVMQFLTLIATIFIPLTFITGVFGMNFVNMPELHYTYGQPVVLAVMALIAGGMIYWFHRKGWLRLRR